MQIFLLDILDNLPRLRISNTLMNAFLWVLREGGARDVPTLYHLRQVQASLRQSTGVSTTQHKSSKGNVYSMNDPRALVAMVRNITVFAAFKFRLQRLILSRTGLILRCATISIAIQLFPRTISYPRFITRRNGERMWIHTC